jgi:hypothetical protein
MSEKDKGIITMSGVAARDEVHEWDKTKHDVSMGISAQVERSKSKGELAGRANLALGDLAAFIGAANEDHTKELTYLGSAAIHIWIAPTLNRLFFISQTAPLNDTPEMVAADAFRQLRGDMENHYGRKRSRKRSGI